jgi:hypothetical protein
MKNKLLKIANELIETQVYDQQEALQVVFRHAHIEIGPDWGQATVDGDPVSLENGKWVTGWI